jgi:hypothetical protein
VAVVPLTVVANEMEAEMLCGTLRANGIACERRSAGFVGGLYGSAVSSAMSGQAALTQVLVDEAQLEEARTLLPDRR